jgi:hypothetical protein
VHVDWNAAAVVDNSNTSVGLKNDVDFCGVTSHSLIDRVVDYFINEVVEPSLACGADIHARTLTDSIKALEDRDSAGVISLLGHVAPYIS